MNLKKIYLITFILISLSNALIPQQTKNNLLDLLPNELWWKIGLNLKGDDIALTYIVQDIPLKDYQLETLVLRYIKTGKTKIPEFYKTLSTAKKRELFNIFQRLNNELKNILIYVLNHPLEEIDFALKNFMFRFALKDKFINLPLNNLRISEINQKLSFAKYHFKQILNSVQANKNWATKQIKVAIVSKILWHPFIILGILRIMVLFINCTYKTCQPNQLYSQVTCMKPQYQSFTIDELICFTIALWFLYLAKNMVQNLPDQNYFNELEDIIGTNIQLIETIKHEFNTSLLGLNK